MLVPCTSVRTHARDAKIKCQHLWITGSSLRSCEKVWSSHRSTSTCFTWACSLHTKIPWTPRVTISLDYQPNPVNKSITTHSISSVWFLPQICFVRYPTIRFGLSPMDVVTPHGLLMLRNCFLDFAVEHWFGCRATESGFAGDIGAIEVWLIDWLIDWLK